MIPFKFIKGLFDSVKSGTLNVRREDLEEHLKSTYLDSLCEEELGSMSGFINPTEPSVPFNLSESKLSEVEKYLKLSKNSIFTRTKWCSICSI